MSIQTPVRSTGELQAAHDLLLRTVKVPMGTDGLVIFNTILDVLCWVLQHETRTHGTFPRTDFAEYLTTLRMIMDTLCPEPQQPPEGSEQ